MARHEMTVGYDFEFDRESSDVAALDKLAKAALGGEGRDVQLDGRIWCALWGRRFQDNADIGHDETTLWSGAKGRRAEPSRLRGFSPSASIDDALGFCAAIAGEDAALEALQDGASRAKGIEALRREVLSAAVASVASNLRTPPAPSP